MTDINDINDAADVLERLGGVTEPTDVETYRVDDFNRIIYNPISKEAARTGQLEKYRSAAKQTGSVTVDDITIHYAIPKEVTAYDAVPIQYTTSGLGSCYPLYIEATAYGEESRDGDYYDLTLPGTIDADIVYDGYVSGSLRNDYRPVLSGKTDDKQGTAYPSYEASDLIRSGTLPVADLIWLKFTYTNSGNTIWDSDGNGTFCFQPVLYKKNASGEWVTTDQYKTNNLYERIFDYVYPGESGEMYVQFQQEGLSSGDYRVVIHGNVHQESGSNSWQNSFLGGTNVIASAFEFTVSKSGEITEPKPVEKLGSAALARSGWLRTYEEFMTSYESLIFTDGAEGTMYLQCAPWTESITLRVMTGNEDNMKLVRIPIQVESDSIRLYLNEENDNYRINEDGGREPLVMAQTMADMRSNTQRGPDPASTIVNDLLDMKEAGVNYLSSTMAFGYDPPTSGTSTMMPYDANKFMMDVARTLGLQMEGYSSYPYEWAGLYSPNISSITAPNHEFSDPAINTANAVLANYTFQRYADMLYQAPDGTIPISTEDTRGWLRVDYSGIFAFSEDTRRGFGEWLKGRYPTIQELNQAYGSNYTDFDSIDIVSDASGSTNGGYATLYTFFDNSKVFHDWSRAMLDFDLYRSVERARDYIDMLSQIPTVTPPKNTTDTVLNPKVLVRTEGTPFITPGVDPATDNPHYRHIYYAQRRNAVVGEIMAASGAVYGHSNYVYTPFTPAEVYELVSRSKQAGIVEHPLPLFNSMQDVVLNNVTGQTKFVQDYNLANESGQVKGAYIRTQVALFPWFKAVYEAGGVPGILWQDYIGNSMCTSTQYKELKFYKEKMEEMLSTDEGKAWASNPEQPDQGWRETTATAWSYPEQYIRQTVDSTQRKCIFEGLYR